MGLFYAYFTGFNPPYKYLVTFVNREVADEWWREISTAPSPCAGLVKRISPQLYIQAKANDRFHGSQLLIGGEFFGKMFVTSIYDPSCDNLAQILPTDISDHISGRWYFIRSKADPSSHWYLHTSGTCAVCGEQHCNALHVSSQYRTRFCVRVRDVSEVPTDFVMIGTDAISITGPKGDVLYIHDAGDVKATKGYQGETDLVFGDLQRRFVVRVERQVNGEVWEYVASVERGVGEVWALVE